MDDLLLEPLKYYEAQGKQQHHDNAMAYFDELVERSGMDVEENRKTVKLYHGVMEKIKELKSKISKYKWLRVLAILGIIVGAILLISAFSGGAGGFGIFVMVVLGLGAIVGCIFAIVKKLNPLLKDFNAVVAEQQKIADEYLAQAKAQMAALNELFDDNDTKKLIEKTLPDMKIDPKFTVERYDTLRNQYDYAEMTDEESSVVNVLSGEFFGNPFIFQRYLRHKMGTHTYTGTLQISWTETYRDSNGNLCTRRRYQTLTATVTKPKPYYTYHTFLGYGHQAAPSLSFSRESTHAEKKSDKAIERMVKSGEKKIQKQAQKAIKKGESFTAMANSEFDVLFGATDRDNEMEFRLLFTPLAQTGMTKLIRSDVGYGDDFNFYKHRRYNIIASDHAQNWDMNTSGNRYRHYDVDESRKIFVEFNDTYFKNMFFDFAPLLTIPAYQEKPMLSMVPYEDTEKYFTTEEHEVLANAIDSSAFAHSQTATKVILKTSPLRKENSVDCVKVTAYSYATEDRIDYVPVYGGDGRWHNVPVPWIEYIPLERTSAMAMAELDLTEREYRHKLSDEGFAETVGNLSGRSAYAHGLYAYALDEDEGINSVYSNFDKLNINKK